MKKDYNIPYRITREKAPLYWVGWASVYVQVLKYGVPAARMNGVNPVRQSTYR